MIKPIYFAPLQGYTDDVYRRIHHELVGGIESYFTPFVRMEGGGVRTKDMRDIRPEFNKGVPVVPQVIAKTMKEFTYLTDIVEAKGYKWIDINMGCPFPLQAKHGRGSGLLAHTDIIEEMAKAIDAKKDINFSVKIRLGWESKDEWRPVLDILNGIHLRQITLHPRIGIQQYKGELDMDSFFEFYAGCKHQLVYNGELKTVKEMQLMVERFPGLAGIMVGRGLLARPSLAAEYESGEEWPEEKRRAMLHEFHNRLMAHYETTANSEAQLHGRLRLFWEYMEEELGRKLHKKIMKAGNLKNYLAAVREV